MLPFPNTFLLTLGRFGTETPFVESSGRAAVADNHGVGNGTLSLHCDRGGLRIPTGLASRSTVAGPVSITFMGVMMLPLLHGKRCCVCPVEGTVELRDKVLLAKAIPGERSG